MTSTLSKRQQARNEKALHDLVHNVPGNNFCADCQARNPGWASWSLGVFLCMRCAAIHRKLGTHVSKVKSLSMDSWSNEQVENMRKVGNSTSNKVYNPQNKKPPVPLDADEADSAMERFIRLKYMSHGLGTTKRHNTGSTESDETPPPLPPKTPSRFGFRSASSIFPLGSKAKRESAAREAVSSPRDLPGSPTRRNKASQVFGASVDSDGEDTERKLAKLRDIGFTDDQRNAVVLKGVNGNLERTVEALIRLGGGGRRSPLSFSSNRDDSLSATQAFTPVTPATPSSATNPPRSARAATPSNNPFDMPAAQPQSSQSTGTIPNKNPYLNTNPFGIPQQNDQALNQAIQNMSLAPSQPLFPHHTGGVPAAQQQHNTFPLYQQSLTPPMPSTAFLAAQYQPIHFGSSQTYPQPAPVPQAGYNPFFAAQQQQQQQQPQPQPGLSVNTTAFLANQGNNPFTRSPTRIQSPTLGQIPEQAQQDLYAAPPQQHQPTTNNPFFGQFGGAPQQAFQMPQATQLSMRPDKASIMALYNYPHLAPAPLPRVDEQSQLAIPVTNQAPSLQPPPVAPQQQQAVPDVSSAAPGSKNPFLNYDMPATALPATANQSGVMERPTMKHNVSRDSMMALGLEWTNGRHSPDAFASLSAKDMR